MMVGTVKDTDKKTGKEYDKEVWEVLVLSPESEAYNVTGGDVRDAHAGVGPETASPEVCFSFNASGGVKFGRVTGEHVPIGDFQYHLAIVLDNVLQTAPTIRARSPINGRITGDFTQTGGQRDRRDHQRRQPARRPGADSGPRHDHRGHAGQGHDPAEQATP